MESMLYVFRVCISSAGAAPRLTFEGRRRMRVVGAVASVLLPGPVVTRE